MPSTRFDNSSNAMLRALRVLRDEELLGGIEDLLEIEDAKFRELIYV